MLIQAILHAIFSGLGLFTTGADYIIYYAGLTTGYRFIDHIMRVILAFLLAMIFYRVARWCIRFLWMLIKDFFRELSAFLRVR